MQGIRYYFNDYNGNVEIKKCENSIHSCKEHFHDEVSIGLVEKGNCSTKMQSGKYEISENTILIIPQNVVHKCTPYSYKNWNFRMIYINEDWFKTVFNRDKLDIKFSYRKLNKIAFKNAYKLFVDIENNIMNIENETKLINYVSFLEYDRDKNWNKQAVKVSNLAELEKIKKYIDKNYLNNLTLKDLAEMSHMSKYCVVRQFENCYGISPHKYITNLRINYAKRLIRKNRNFADAALESGFYDQSHFIKYFKDYTGVTPGMYKQ